MSEKIIKKAVSDGKAVMGISEVTGGMKAGGLSSVFYASNCPGEMLRQLTYYASLSKVSLEKFGGDSVKLGQVCGKPFNITVLGIRK